MSLENIENDLISEIKLSSIEARVFLLITTKGKMSSQKIADSLKISTEQSVVAIKKLIDLGSLIDISDSEFEAMHPRFTAVNMYRKMCERNDIVFKRNKIVDNIGVVLERFYDAARTK